MDVCHWGGSLKRAGAAQRLCSSLMFIATSPFYQLLSGSINFLTTFYQLLSVQKRETKSGYV
jgi:hypothetical protein